MEQDTMKIHISITEIDELKEGAAVTKNGLSISSAFKSEKINLTISANGTVNELEINNDDLLRTLADHHVLGKYFG